MKSKRNYFHTHTKRKRLIAAAIAAKTTAKSPYWLAHTLYKEISKLSTFYTRCVLLYRRPWQLVSVSIDKKNQKAFSRENKNPRSETITGVHKYKAWLCFEFALNWWEKLRPLLLNRFFSSSCKHSKKIHDNWYYSSNIGMDFIYRRLEFIRKRIIKKRNSERKNTYRFRLRGITSKANNSDKKEFTCCYRIQLLLLLYPFG